MEGSTEIAVWSGFARKYNQIKWVMSQEQLAEKLGVSRQAISRWESGESKTDMLNL